MRPRLHQHLAATACATLLLAGAARADTGASGIPPVPEVTTELPEARARGTGSLRWLGLPVYDARLWSPEPLAGDGASQPLAIEVRYHRGLSGQRIAQRSIDEMKRLAPLTETQAQRWLQALQGLIPDVRAGDRITAVQHPGQAARFFVNGRPVGEVTDPEFVRLFFGIWLSARTSEPALRAQMIGAAR